MSRSCLTLYELDRPALKQVSDELRTVLMDDDRGGLSKLLELSDAMAEKLSSHGGGGRLVDRFLLPAEHERSKALFASLRRICKKRALTPMFSSSALSLEGRLRELEVLRDHRQVATALDKLMNPKRLPWYLRRSNATCGWLGGDQRDALANDMRSMRHSLPSEVAELLTGLDEIDGDVVLHDSL